MKSPVVRRGLLPLPLPPLPLPPPLPLHKLLAHLCTICCLAFGLW